MNYKARKSKILEHNCSEICVSYKPSILIKKPIEDSKEAYQILLDVWDMAQFEYIECSYMLMLNRQNKVLGWSMLSKGSPIGVQIDERVVCQTALITNASSVIIAHNHPSGTLKPSDADKLVTKKVKEALNTIRLHLLDHIIVTNDGYYSFLENGLL